MNDDLFKNGIALNTFELRPSYGSQPLNCSFSQYVLSCLKEVVILLLIVNICYSLKAEFVECFFKQMFKSIAAHISFGMPH